MFIIKFDIKIYIDKYFIYLIIERIVISCKICFDRQFYYFLFSFFIIYCSFISNYYVCITIIYLFLQIQFLGAERFQYYNYRKKDTLLNCIINIIYKLVHRTLCIVTMFKEHVSHFISRVYIQTMIEIIKHSNMI